MHRRKTDPSAVEIRDPSVRRACRFSKASHRGLPCGLPCAGKNGSGLCAGGWPQERQGNLSSGLETEMMARHTRHWPRFYPQKSIYKHQKGPFFSPFFFYFEYLSRPDPAYPHTRRILVAARPCIRGIRPAYDRPRIRFYHAPAGHQIIAGGFNHRFRHIPLTPES